MKTILFRCIEGMSDNDNVNVIMMKNDVVKLNSVVDGYVNVEGVSGWCYGVELNFTPYQFVTYFESK